MSTTRLGIAMLLGLWLASRDWPDAWIHVSLVSLGWWHAWSCYAAPPLSEIMRRIGRIFEAMG